MIQVAQFDINTDQIAFYREIQRKLNGPRQTAPTRVAPTAKHTANQPELTVETRQKDELFQGHADSSESVNTSAEVASTVDPAELLARFKQVALGRAYGPASDDEFQPLTLADIRAEVMQEFRLSKIDFMSERRTASVVRPRQAAMHLARKYTTQSLPAIGRFYGGKDHTTVLHGDRQTIKRMAEDEAFRVRIEAIEARLAERAMQ